MTGNTVTTGYVDVDDTELFYRTAGDGPAVVFVHAGVTDHRLWDAQFEALTEDYRVVAYDLRGFGDSTLPETAYSHHEDLADVLDGLDIQVAHLVGASMGGSVVLDFALEHPDRVASLCLVAPALGGYQFTDEATMDAWAAAGEALAAGDPAEAARIESDQWLAGPTRDLTDVDPAVRSLVDEMLRRRYEHETPDTESIDLDPPAINRLDEIQVPVLLLSGALDRPDMHAIAERLETGIGNVQTTTIPDAAHLPSLERPAVVADEIASILDGLRA